MANHITDIQALKARRFFERLRDSPFLAVVVDGDDVHIYTKGIESDEVDNLLDAIEAAGGEEQ